MKPTALIYCDRASAVTEMAALAEGLVRDGRFKPVLFLGKNLTPSELAPFGDIERAIAPLEGPARWAGIGRLSVYYALPRIAGILHKRAGDYADAAIRLKIFKATAEKIIKKLNPSIVIIPDDRIMRYNLGLILAARAHNLPVVLVPFAMSDPIWEASSRLARGIAVEPSVTNYFPTNIFRMPDGRQTMFYGAGQAKALIDAGLTFTTPWLVGGGDIDAICVTSSAHQATLINGHIPKDRIHLTGRPSADPFFNELSTREEKRQDLCHRYNIDMNQKIIAFNPPTYGEVGLMDKSTAINYIRSICTALKPYNKRTVVSLHPRMEYKNYRWIESEFGLPITDQPIREYICAIDILVSYLSSINLWAANLHIPVVQLNGVGHPDTAYTSLPGVVPATPETLPEALSQVIETHIDYDAFENTLGPFDGQCTKRIADVLEHLAKI
ncbi:CDP-glycerol glycerophosphotransferase family protein [Magnetospirillum fulvum]|uniref:CDP-Glycerol:Poly(Glycerophosphate) glycerophosphotransferase n=1 Tax=Magnetospirillum fulvum TaxID=1082 RepID=A0A1H6J4S1_MAGFU|nr:CDP-glycerol glycerophosphotransferase family protein [Magnetospirillum fulvum]SEH53823.1 CDP-Glycerol:Poly(glycerophosphate) glycerophosphotransferase [Magnetospirillum fulvum]